MMQPLPDNPMSDEAPAGNHPPPPAPVGPSADWEHRKLYDAVVAALYALPSMFESEFNISGVLAPDLYTLNTSLGASLEVQVVEQLNAIRRVWDEERTYALYRWVRQPQTFPDVLLRASAPDVEPQVLMGIELKGWYVLAKEQKPSFRYTVSPAVCQPQDLLVVVPWALSNVVSGSPRLFEPYVVEARFAAAYRNYHWQHIRQTSDPQAITLSTVEIPYPVKSDQISDIPEYDQGGNFGRYARTKLMDDYIAALRESEIVGVPLWAWQGFLEVFSEDWKDENVVAALRAVERQKLRKRDGLTTEQVQAVRAKLIEIADLVRGD